MSRSNRKRRLRRRERTRAEREERASAEAAAALLKGPRFPDGIIDPANVWQAQVKIRTP